MTQSLAGAPPIDCVGQPERGSTSGSAVALGHRIAGYFLGDVGARALTFLFLVAAARATGAEGYGRFAFGYAIVAIGLLVSDLGLTALLMRRLSAEDDTAEVFWTATAINVVLGAASYALIVLVLWITTSDGSIALAYGLVMPIQGAATSFDARLLSLGMGRRLGLLRLFSNGLMCMAAIPVLLVFPNPVAPAILLTGACLLKMTLGGVSIAGRVGRPTLAPEAGRVLLRQAIPFALAAVVSFLYFRIDVVLLGVLSSSASVGQYAAAYRLVDGAMLLPTAVALTSFTAWTRIREPDDLARAAVVVLYVGSAVGALFVVASHQLMSWLYGGDFGGSGQALGILGFGIPVLFIDVVAVWIAYACGRERGVIRVGAAALVANLALNAVLIPRLDFRGAAFATIVSEVVNLAGYCVLFSTELWMYRNVVGQVGRRWAFASGVAAAACASCAAAGVPRAGQALITALPFLVMAARGQPLAETTSAAASTSGALS